MRLALRIPIVLAAMIAGGYVAGEVADRFYLPNAGPGEWGVGSHTIDNRRHHANCCHRLRRGRRNPNQKTPEAAGRPDFLISEQIALF